MTTTQVELQNTRGVGKFAKAIAAFVMLTGFALPNANAAFLQRTTAISPPTIYFPGLSQHIGDSFSNAGDTFLDHYTFTLGGAGFAVGDVLSVTIGNALSLDQFGGGLYTGGGTLVSPSVVTFNAAGPFPETKVLSFASLSGGDYDFHVSGNVVGIGGGSYGGTLTVFTAAAIPEPEIYAMMGAGLGLMGFVARRRKGQRAIA